MTEKEVKKLIKEENWDDFLYWMRGQTCGMNENGSFDYYEDDVQAFIRKLKNEYDRQNDPFAWD